MEAKVNGAFNITENPFDGNHVRRARRAHKLGHIVDDKGNIWAGKGEILKTPHKFMVFYGKSEQVNITGN